MTDEDKCDHLFEGIKHGHGMVETRCSRCDIQGEEVKFANQEDFSEAFEKSQKVLESEIN